MGLVTRMKSSHYTTGILWENLKNRGNLEERVLDWMIKLKWILIK
jgi:hypothetical protein